MALRKIVLDSTVFLLRVLSLFYYYCHFSYNIFGSLMFVCFLRHITPFDGGVLINSFIYFGKVVGQERGKARSKRGA